MEDKCLNCGQEISGNYCSNCGQKKYRRIDRKYIIEEAQYSLLHTNKGFLYSVKSILKNPGKTAREFVEGNRVNHYKPILLAFVLSGISAFIAIKLIRLYDIMEQMTVNGKNVGGSSFMHEYSSFMTSYNSFIALLMIPFFALLTKLVFYKWGHNYYEHVVINAFILSYNTILYILVLYPIMYFFRDNTNLVLLMTMSVFLFMPFILVWFFKEFYAERKFKNILLRILLFFGILGFLYIALSTILVIVLVLISGPEALLQMQQQAR